MIKTVKSHLRNLHLPKVGKKPIKYHRTLDNGTGIKNIIMTLNVKLNKKDALLNCGILELSSIIVAHILKI